METNNILVDIWDIWYLAKDEETQMIFDKGIQFMDNGDFDTAIKLFSETIESSPDFAEAWNKRATVYFMMGDFDKSMQDIIKTLELEPRHFGALDGMGLIFIHQGQFQQAIDVYDKMLEIFPFSLKTMEKRENIMSFISQST